jgi:hypothetical protein
MIRPAAANWHATVNSNSDFVPSATLIQLGHID